MYCERVEPAGGKKVIKRFVIPALLFLLICTGARAEDVEYLVKFKNGTVPTGCEERVVYSGYENVYITNDASIENEFAEFIEYIEPNGKTFLIEDVKEISTFSVPEDKYYPIQWQIQMIDAQSAWDIETYGNEINVAVIDSGVSMHPDIAKSIAGGYNYVTDSTDFSDKHGHGTHVAGLIASVHNEIGIPGVAPKVNIYALKCIEPGVAGDELTLAKAIRGAVDDYNCKVINMSLGTKVNNTILYEAVKYVYSKGVVMIAAVGNEYNSSLYYPAAYEEVIGVGSVEYTKEKSNFSQYNKSVFAVAPGRKSASLHVTEDGGFGYAERSGTSQASPLVAGAAAIMLSADSSMTDEKFRELIKSTSEDLGTKGYDIYYGWGLINIGRMLDELTKPYPCYISPENDGDVLIYNKSETAVNTKVIIAGYNDGFDKADFSTAIILPGRKIKIKASSDAKKCKLFLWNFDDNIKPLAKDRMVE